MRVGLIVALLCSTASATTVRGAVTLPAEPRPSDRWRIEDGTIAIGPLVPDPRTEVVVALENAAERGARVPNATVSLPIADRVPHTLHIEHATAVALHGLRIDPRVVVIPIGGSVEFQNKDRVSHTLYVEHATWLMKPEPIPAGKVRTQRFTAAGEYRIRDDEYPHVEGVVLVLKTPYFTRLDDNGQFAIDLPDGEYTLRVFFRDRWVETRRLEVGPSTTEVTVQVPASAMRAKP